VPYDQKRLCMSQLSGDSAERAPRPAQFFVGDEYLTNVEAVTKQITRNDLSVYSTQLNRVVQEQGLLTVRGRLLRPSEEVFPGWLRAFNAEGYTPFLRPLADGAADEVELHVVSGVAPKTHHKLWINGLLFALTVVSTLFVGSLYGEAGASVTSAWQLLQPSFLISGWPFAATLLGILAAHEFGHYFAARYHKVGVTLPYFIPMPLGFGTLGAFIRMTEPVPDRRKLFDIGVAGPLAGLVLAVPLLVVGLNSSPMRVPMPSPNAMLEGNSILYYTAKYLVFGKVLPNPITGEDVLMNQVTFAAWIGLLVTALNLLPVGQLDGGHTVFALFGEKARYINKAAIGVLALFAIASLAPVQAVLPVAERVGFNGWFIWLLLIMMVIGPYHPPALDDVTRLDFRRRLVGYAVIVIFILTFVPVPMRMMG
jgi:membrane-associated protease RseP (regulator of RpoE activity)